MISFASMDKASVSVQLAITNVRVRISRKLFMRHHELSQMYSMYLRCFNITFQPARGSCHHQLLLVINKFRCTCGVCVNSYLYSLTWDVPEGPVLRAVRRPAVTSVSATAHHAALWRDPRVTASLSHQVSFRVDASHLGVD